MLGWVSVNGSVRIETTGARFVSDDVFASEQGGRDMMNGIEGDVMLNVRGAGSMSVARACSVTLCDSERTSKACRVMSCEMSGKGASRPGVGKPGIGGTKGWRSEQGYRVIQNTDLACGQRPAYLSGRL